MIIPLPRRALLPALAAAAAVAGTIAAVHYDRLGLTLSHYDARGHLVVARRIFDSLTPGWQQIGAVWLPLPHLLNAIPVQIDAFYRNGASAVVISIVSFAIATGALAWIVLLITDSAWAAAVGAAVFALNPNVVYLQATPMTEPLLIGLMTLAVAMLMAGLQAGRTSRATSFPESRATSTGVVFGLACLTRYEAWPVTASALALAIWARRRPGDTWRDAARRIGAIAIYPAGAVLAFAVFSRIVIGAWFVSGNFFVPENTALGHPIEALAQIGWGVRALSGSFLVAASALGLLALAVRAWRDANGAAAPALSLAATAAVPWLAFLQGHPYRIRYMVPLMAAEAVGVGVAAGTFRRARPLAPIALLLVTTFALHPFDTSAPMAVEAQWDRPNVSARQTVGNCLRAQYRGEHDDSIMASMGSLGHYMQELSHDGFSIRDFLHEGNGDIWLAAIEQPLPYAGWILIEEKAEGGDMLARRARAKPEFLAGFSRVCEGGGVALYRRE